MAISAPTSARDALAEQLPGSLRSIARLAFNLWWSWQPGGDDVWRAIDAERWEACGGGRAPALRKRGSTQAIAAVSPG